MGSTWRHEVSEKQFFSSWKFCHWGMSDFQPTRVYTHIYIFMYVRVYNKTYIYILKYNFNINITYIIHIIITRNTKVQQNLIKGFFSRFQCRCKNVYEINTPFYNFREQSLTTLKLCESESVLWQSNIKVRRKVTPSLSNPQLTKSARSLVALNTESNLRWCSGTLKKWTPQNLKEADQFVTPSNIIMFLKIISQNEIINVLQSSTKDFPF